MTTEQYSMGYEAGHTDGWNEAVNNLTKPPAPDCRTCEWWPECNSGMQLGCTNGDQYQPAPSVVLWK